VPTRLLEGQGLVWQYMFIVKLERNIRNSTEEEQVNRNVVN
jgi:hypothetical protein